MGWAATFQIERTDRRPRGALATLLRQPFKSQSHARVFAFLYAGLVLVCGLIWQTLAYLDTVYRRGELEEVAMAENDVLVRHLSSTLRSFAGELFVAVRHPASRSLYDRNGPAERQAVAGIFRLLAEESATITQIRFIDENGDEVVRVHRRHGEVVVVPDDELQNKSDRYYVIETSRLEVGEVYASPLDLNVEHGVVQVPWVRTLRLATPVADSDGKRRGMIVLNLDASAILEPFLDRSGSAGQHYALLNGDGYWLAGVPADRMFGFMFGRSEATLAVEQPDVWQRIAASSRGTFLHDRLIHAVEAVTPHQQIETGPSDDRHIVSDTSWIVLTRHPMVPRIGLAAPGGMITATTSLVLLAIGAWIWSGAIVARRLAIAAEQRTRAHLVQAEKMAALGQLVAGIAHELNTPIGNAVTIGSAMSDRIRACSQELATGTIRKSTITALVADFREGTDIMLGGLFRASELIAQFKQIAADQSGEQRRTFPLDTYVEEVVASIRFTTKHRRAKLSVHAASGLTMNSFPGPLGQVLINLANNAFVHGFPDDEPGSIVVTASCEGRNAVLTVADSGRGIPADIRRKIFDPFFTTRLGTGGTGLGLSIVHGIVTDVLGGTITMESVPGQSTVFRLVIPVDAPPQKLRNEDFDDVA
ncbi:MAG: sensor histidine kinase [Rhodospirillaceae bacterium]|nr:sensor histidine kinase [Rhodospirillaceae bacterium]